MNQEVTSSIVNTIVIILLLLGFTFLIYHNKKNPYVILTKEQRRARRKAQTLRQKLGLALLLICCVGVIVGLYFINGHVNPGRYFLISLTPLIIIVLIRLIGARRGDQ